jgi:transposase
MRPGRLGSGWRGRYGLRGSAVWWRRPRSYSARPGIGSRPMPTTPRHLARLLHLGEIVEVTMPSVEQEAARDLVRAREDCRGDLMAAPRRLSKLLLRRETSTTAGTRGRRDTRRGCGHTDSPSAGCSWPMTPLRHHAGHPGSPQPPRCRDHRDGRRFDIHPGGDPTGLRAGHRHPHGVRIGHRDRRLAPFGRPNHRRLSRVCTHRELLGATRYQGGVTKTGNGHARRLLVEAAWHHRAPYRPGSDLRSVGISVPDGAGPWDSPPTGGYTPAGCASMSARNAP